MTERVSECEWPGVDWPTLPVSGLVPPSVNYAQGKTAKELITDGLNNFNNYILKFTCTYTVQYITKNAYMT